MINQLARLSLVGLLMLLVSMAKAETLSGTLGSSSDYGSGWIDLNRITDFKRGDKLKIKVGGTARTVRIRLLPKGKDPNRPIGLIGGAIEVPINRLIEIELADDHSGVEQISVHGGPKAWSHKLGQDNGPAEIDSVERIGK